MGQHVLGQDPKSTSCTVLDGGPQRLSAALLQNLCVGPALEGDFAGVIKALMMKT